MYIFIFTPMIRFSVDFLWIGVSYIDSHNQFMTCASDKNVHGPYSTPHPPHRPCTATHITLHKNGLEKGSFQLHMVTGTFNPNIQKSEAGGSLNWK